MKKLFTAITLGAWAATLTAAPVSPEAALQKALRNVPAKVATGANGKGFALQRTFTSKEMDAVYLFTHADGNAFIVTPADDTAPALLGYGATPAADAEGRIAPGFEYWLNELSRQVAYGATIESPAALPLKERPQREAIAPLCSTKWNQSSPYNDMCPENNGVHAVTGCVATAMAQVMKYHNWPEQGAGAKMYMCPPYGLLKITFSKQTFDWENMLDEYDASSPQESKDAVALLMKCAGYSVEMNYSPQGSGAASIYIAQALGKNFKYDKSLSYLLRDYYALYDWEDIIYNSLSTDGPVIYDGQSGLGGHSFVCDGYESDGYFHFNWGWGGVSDGYFLLDALDPLHQGIGGADGGFDYLQDIIVGIRPDQEGTSSWNATMIINSNVEMSYDPEEQAVHVEGAVYNMGPGALPPEASIGLRYTPLEDGYPTQNLYPIEEELPLGYGFTAFDLPMAVLDDGQYKVEIIYTLGEDSEPRVALAPLYDSGVSILTLENGDVSFELVEPGFPEFYDAVYPEETDLLNPVNVTGRIENPTGDPMLSILTVILLDESMEKLYGYSNPWACDLEEHESRQLDINTKIANIQARPAEGTQCYIGLAEWNVRSGYIYLLSEPALTTINSQSGISVLPGESESSEREMYGLDGSKASSAGALSPGIYILKRGSETNKILIK